MIYYIETETLEINRLDIDPIHLGWGQDLKLLVHNKITHLDNIIHVGSSKQNSVSIKYKYISNTIS